MKRRCASIFPFVLLGLLGAGACESGAPPPSDADGPPSPAEPDETGEPDGPDEAPPAGSTGVFQWPDDSPMALMPVDPMTHKSQGEAAQGGDAILPQPPDPDNFVINISPVWIRQDQGLATTSGEIAFGVAAAPDNTVYVVGSTQGSLGNVDGDLTGAPYGKYGGADAFIARYSPSGALLWRRQLGSTVAGTNEYATSVAFSAAGGGAVYVAGYTSGVVAQAGGQPANTSAGKRDIFLAKLSPDGALQWTRQRGTALDDTAWGVAVELTTGHANANGEVYVTGETLGVWPTQSSKGSTDAFLQKCDPNGTWGWARQIGTSSNDYARGVAVDSDTNIYIAGDTGGGMNAPNAAGHGPFTSAGASDIFLAKYSGLGALIDLDQRGTAKAEYGHGVAVSRKAPPIGGSLSVYVAGHTLGDWFKVNPGPAGAYDCIGLRYQNAQAGAAPAPADLTFQQGSQSGFTGSDLCYGVATDGLANAYAATTIVPAGAPTWGAVVKYDAGGTLTAIKSLMSIVPARGNDIARAVAADFDSGVYLGGQTTAAFDYSTPDTTTVHIGSTDAALARYLMGCNIDGQNPGLCGVGWGWGDPHLRTFDGLPYDFQTTGEFVLVESTAGTPFTVQTRQRMIPGHQVAIYTGVATMIGADRVALYSEEAAELRINGAPATVAPGDIRPLSGGGSLLRRPGGDYVLRWPSGEQMLVGVYPGSHINLYLLVLPFDRKGQVRGLLGDYNDYTGDDFALRGGGALGSSLTFNQMYKDPGNFADSWRIAQAESLFDYAPGQSTATFTDPSVPAGPMTLGALPAADRQAAQQACAAAGVTDPVLLDQCTMDVAVTGDATAADGAAVIQAKATEQGLPPMVQQEVAVYSADMETPPGAEWSFNATCTSPSGDRHMLGELGNDLVTLNLPALPPHGMITVTFDVILINGWDGEGPFGPSVFGVIDEHEGALLATTFSNTSSWQSYPGPYPSGNLPGTGAAEVNTLYYPLGDSVYQMGFTYPHTAGDLALHFYADGLTGWNGEAWAIDNVNVVVGPAP